MQLTGCGTLHRWHRRRGGHGLAPAQGAPGALDAERNRDHLCLDQGKMSNRFLHWRLITSSGSGSPRDMFRHWAGGGWAGVVQSVLAPTAGTQLDAQMRTVPALQSCSSARHGRAQSGRCLCPRPRPPPLTAPTTRPAPASCRSSTRIGPALPPTLRSSPRTGSMWSARTSLTSTRGRRTRQVGLCGEAGEPARAPVGGVEVGLCLG